LDQVSQVLLAVTKLLVGFISIMEDFKMGYRKRNYFEGLMKIVIIKVEGNWKKMHLYYLNYPNWLSHLSCLTQVM